MGEYSGCVRFAYALGGVGVLEGDSVRMDDMAVKMLAREGGLVDVSGSKFYDFR
jgi:hypothetical protein